MQFPSSPCFLIEASPWPWAVERWDCCRTCEGRERVAFTGKTQSTASFREMVLWRRHLQPKAGAELHPTLCIQLLAGRTATRSTIWTASALVEPQCFHGSVEQRGQHWQRLRHFQWHRDYFRLREKSRLATTACINTHIFMSFN